MRIESALYASREGLSVHGQAMSVLGDNIANSNTTAYKSNRIEFAELLEQGSGAMVQDIKTIFTNGGSDSTGRALDAAIDGDGFFVVTDSQDNTFYTRAGNFTVNQEGKLVTPDGFLVQGLVGDSTTELTDLDLVNLTSQNVATSSASISGNLDASQANGTAPANPLTYAALGQSASFINSLTVYDSLGEAHDVALAYTKTGVNQWVAQAYIDGGEVGGTAGQPVQIGANVTLSFNSAGSIEVANQAAAVITGAPQYSNGAATGAFTIELGSMTQFSANSQLSKVTQNGQSGGDVVSYQFNSDGSISAVLSSGNTVQVGQLAIASFNTNDGLERIGGTLYADRGLSGDPAYSAAGANGTGAVEGSALERSNVDIATQFVDMVVYQRGYQANSQCLNAAASLIRDTIQMIR